MTCTIGMQFEASQVGPALELLRTAIPTIRRKRDCCSCYLVRDAENERTLRYIEEWTSAEAFNGHVQSDDFWPILLAIDLCATRPEVRIGEVAVRGGLDALLQLRIAPAWNSEQAGPLEPIAQIQDQSQARLTAEPDNHKTN